MDDNLIFYDRKNFNHVTLNSTTSVLFDEEGQTKMISIFRRELSQYQIMLNELFGMHPQKQRQIYFLSDGLLSSALYFEVKNLQNALLKLKKAAHQKNVSQILLDAVNQEINFLLSVKQTKNNSLQSEDNQESSLPNFVHR